MIPRGSRPSRTAARAVYHRQAVLRPSSRTRTGHRQATTRPRSKWPRATASAGQGSRRKNGGGMIPCPTALKNGGGTGQCPPPMERNDQGPAGWQRRRRSRTLTGWPATRTEEWPPHGCNRQRVMCSAAARQTQRRRLRRPHQRRRQQQQQHTKNGGGRAEATPNQRQQRHGRQKARQRHAGSVQCPFRRKQRERRRQRIQYQYQPRVLPGPRTGFLRHRLLRWRPRCRRRQPARECARHARTHRRKRLALCPRTRIHTRGVGTTQRARQWRHQRY